MKLVLNFLLILFTSMSFFSVTKAEIVYSSSNNILYVPFLEYLGNNYAAEFSFINAEQLALTSAYLRVDTPTYGSVIAVGNQLNFTLERINFDGQLYNANIEYQQDNLFKITGLSSTDEEISGRGSLLKSTLTNQVSQNQFDVLVSLINLQNGTSYDIKAKNDIDIYSVSYQTIDPSGALTTASALIALPTDASKSYPLIAYQHGTEVLRNNAPSQNPNDLASLALAASGYVVVSADFLGLGESTLLHPYVHAHSLATTVIDALRVAKTLSSEKAVTLNGQLFLIGYSEGGYATMAVHRELQRNYSTEFTVTASAPMAGPYDLSGTMVERFFDDIVHPNPYYFPYTVLAYVQTFDIYSDLSDIFQSPYDQTIVGLFDGNHLSSEINSNITGNRNLFTQALYDDLGSGQNTWIKAALTENNVYRWTPDVPMYLFHCVNDDQVPYKNTQVAYNYFQSIGATQVKLFAIEDEDLNKSNVHVNCSIPLLLSGKTLFDAMVE